MVINCKQIAQELKDRVKNRVSELNFTPKLTVITVGSDPASAIYVKQKRKACEHCGIDFENVILPEFTSLGALLGTIGERNSDSSCNGIVVQLPLPKHLQSEYEIIKHAIKPYKDVDGFNKNSWFKPCTPLGILYLLEKSNIPVSGKHVVVIGRSDIVGKPLAKMLLQKDATVTVCHSKTPSEQRVQLCRAADIIISAAGSPGLISPKDMTNCTAVIDVSINRLDNGRIVGDVAQDISYEFMDKYDIAYTTVPGGVGPMTVAALMFNLVTAAEFNVANP